MSELLLHDELPTQRAVKGRSLWEDAWRRLMRNPAAVVSLYVVAILVLVAVFGPMLWVHKVDEIFRDSVAIAPTRVDMHLLGTDTEGRDMVARLQHPTAGPISVNGVPIKLSATPGEVKDPPPLLGQHTDEILSEVLGYTPDQIAEVRQLKAV